MNCIVNNTIEYLVKQGKKSKAIRKYLKEKYHISINTITIGKRIQYLRESTESGLSS
jgi:hypothetical protein